MRRAALAILVGACAPASTTPARSPDPQAASGAAGASANGGARPNANGGAEASADAGAGVHATRHAEDVAVQHPAASNPPASTGTAPPQGTTAPQAADAPAQPLGVETPEDGRVIVHAGQGSVECSAVRAAHAALTECKVRGKTGTATIAWGMSDDPDAVMCTLGSSEYQWEHGGGWNVGEHSRVGERGARVFLGGGVEAWFSRKLDVVEVASPGGSVRVEIDLDAGRVTARAGAGGVRAEAPVLISLAGETTPEGCSAR